ncbi:TonB-dependent siderophore receptor [Luteimonas gilva]|uniref:TonB-dependent siderophore receptor n=1 Tax=Luteimonas gilva TaxID=2572684 RepID=A0A4U5JXE7_9GAMM|nr:TonB-dependent siderophore receptor [Luteimonas gilva]TKR33361.1 TonB-dependent siderophore receptor [Luteimonas gilva]
MSSKNTRRACAVSLLAFALSLPLQSLAATAEDTVLADARDPKTLDKLTVRGQAEPYAAGSTRAGTKTDTPIEEIPQAISVITAEQMRDQNAQSLQEALRYSAGVRTDQYGLDNRGDWFALRGGSSGTTLLNGMRLPLVGWWGVVREEPYAFDRVEVLHGPSSVMAGQNAPGGVVNLVSKRPLTAASREISLQAGNNDHRQLAADFAGPLNDTLSYRLVALWRDNDTQVDYADNERRYIAPSIAWRPSESIQFVAYAEYQKDRNRNTEGFFPWSGTLLPAPNGPIPLERFVGEPAWDVNLGERARAGYEFEYKFNDAWTLRHDLRHDRVRGRIRTMYAAFWEVDAHGNGYGDNALGEDRTLTRLAYGNDDRAKIGNGDVLLEGRLGSGRVKHTFLFGVDAMLSRTKQWTSPDSACPVPFDVYAPVYGDCPERSIDPASLVSTRMRQAGLLLQDQIKIDDRWVLVAGARHDRVDKRLTGADGAETSRSKDSAWTQNFGAVYLAPGGWSPYVAYSESFQPVAGRSRTGEGFDPTRGKQVEAGLKWVPDAYGLTATAAVYKLEETGRLTPDPVDPNFSVQRGRVEAKGIELEANASVGRWDLIVSFTHSKATDEATGFRFESIPENSAALWAAYRIAAVPGLRIGGGARYVGKTWDGADTLATPSNTLFDALIAYETGPWRLSLNAVNLTDKTYFATCLSRGDCWYGAKRRVVAEVGYRW